MKKLRKKKKKNFYQRLRVKSKKQSILPVLFAIGLLSLFSETVRTLPVGALIGENSFNPPYEVPRLNSEIIEKKLLEKSALSCPVHRSIHPNTKILTEFHYH